MTTPMTREIQAVILAVQTYRKFLNYDSEARCFQKSDDRLFGELQAYFCKLPLPSGMTHGVACFEAILRYPIEETLDTQMEELPDHFSFGY